MVQSQVGEPPDREEVGRSPKDALLFPSVRWSAAKMTELGSGVEIRNLRNSKGMLVAIEGLQGDDRVIRGNPGDRYEQI